MKKFLLYFSLLSIFFTSCVSKKNVLYFQDDFSEVLLSNETIDYKLRVGDILRINIEADNFDTYSYNGQPAKIDNQFSNSRELLMIDGYVIDNDGYFNFPLIGKIYAIDKNIEELEKYIFEELKSNDIFSSTNKNMVRIKVINWSFSVLGEVNMPGRFYFDEPNLSIIDAIGMAGDLKIEGVRTNILVLRKDNNHLNKISIDLTDSNTFSSNPFTILPGDIVIINPNTSRIKSAGIIDNVGTAFSVLSFILSSIILINN